MRLKLKLLHIVWIDGRYDIGGGQERAKYKRGSGRISAFMHWSRCLSARLTRCIRVSIERNIKDGMPGAIVPYVSSHSSRF